MYDLDHPVKPYISQKNLYYHEYQFPEAATGGVL